MKYKVKVDQQIYEVEINDLHKQPIIALVNGEPVEVWLESEMGVLPYFASPELAYQSAQTQLTETNPIPESPLPAHPTKVNKSSSLVVAPIPGVIINILVLEGDRVENGQALCVLEAMKMKNTIRSPRTGVIRKVNVLPGQTVQHQDILIEFAD